MTDKDLETIEKKMLELARQKEEYCRINVSKQEALEHFNSINETYKVELINDLEDGKITYYRQGSFTDLCRGPHLPDTSYIKAIKLTGLAGAYWRGTMHNKMLTRTYGITFPKQKMLDEWLVLMEEAKQRDHRKIGKEMELFTFSKLWVPVYRCGCRKELCCATVWRDFCGKYRRNTVTSKSLPHISGM